ncbi:unnamed protein product [Discula destructiva]
MSEATTGRRTLGEIEETSLDEILTTVRTSLNSTSFVNLNQRSISSAVPTSTHTSNHPALSAPSLSKVKSYPIQLLDTLVARHFRATQSAPLSLAGTHLPLIYKLVATLISAPHNKAVVVIDIDAKFDITRVLQCAPSPSSAAVAQTASDSTTPRGEPPLPAAHTAHEPRVALEDLRHVHVYTPARGSPSHIRHVLASAEHYIIYCRHASVAREWWGTIVIGGGSPTALGPGHADVTTGWRSWLRVDRDEIRGFPLGMSAEEALLDRDQRQRAADDSGYTATCAWGSFTFREAADE